MRDAERQAEMKAELYSQRHLDDVERARSARGVRRQLRRLLAAIRRRG